MPNKKWYEDRDFRDAPQYTLMAQRDSWADGYNAAIEAFLKDMEDIREDLGARYPGGEEDCHHMIAPYPDRHCLNGCGYVISEELNEVFREVEDGLKESSERLNTDSE